MFQQIIRLYIPYTLVHDGPFHGGGGLLRQKINFRVLLLARAQEGIN